jgi:hypothetical protein
MVSPFALYERIASPGRLIQALCPFALLRKDTSPSADRPNCTLEPPPLRQLQNHH